MRWFVVLLVAISLLIIGCHSSKKVSSDTRADAVETDSSKSHIVMISFEQTGCFGTCPVHKMVIYQDGSAYYWAERHTKLQGSFMYQFTSEEMEEFLKKAEELDFFKMQAEYTSPITDLPTTIIFFKDGAITHQIKAYSNYPENTQQLIKYLYQVTQNTKWEPFSSK